jgi:endonuclease/exonuclease/phosphatase family metal-dependent hydrolase
VRLRLLTYNVRFGGVGREAALADTIRRCEPDLVLLQEATRPDVVERLSAATGLPTWGAWAGHSVAFLSRLEVAHHEWHRPPWSRRSFLEILPAGLDVRIFGVHLSAVHSNWTERRRVRELRSLLEGIARHQHGFHVVAGDFNTLAPGEELDVARLPYRLRAVLWLSGRRIRWETIQIMLDAGYADAYRALHAADPGHTFPTWDPHVRLDYVFLPRDTLARLQECDVTRGESGAAASDHFPLLAVLDLA